MVPTRYDGNKTQQDKVSQLVEFLIKQAVFLLPVCPEQLGGLPTPRTPSEVRGNHVFSKTGADVTTFFKAGAHHTLALLKQQNITLALLKQKSPSCGAGLRYDGSFSNTLVPKDGVTTALLRQHGISVFTEDDIAKGKNSPFYKALLPYCKHCDPKELEALFSPLLS